MKKAVFFLVMLSILIMASTNGFSQGGFFLGVQAGFSAQKPTLLNFEFNTDTTFLYGVRVGIKFMMVSAEVNYFQAAHNLELKELVAFDWSEREVEFNYLGINLKYFFPLFVFHPYLTVGYGFYTADIWMIDKDTEKRMNAGVGVEVHLGPKFSLMGEGKYQHVKLDISRRELGLGNFTFHAGFNVYF
jgi:hypothetical protein